MKEGRRVDALGKCKYCGEEALENYEELRQIVTHGPLRPIWKTRCKKCGKEQK